MKRISYLGVLAVVFLILMPFAPTYGHAQILLKEALGPGQQLKSAGGKLVIVSKKVNAVIVAPDSIMIPHGKNIKLKIGFYNLSDSPLEVSKDSVRVFLDGKKIKFISEKKLVKEIKTAYSSKKMDINKDQKKILNPYVKDKIRSKSMWVAQIRDRNLLMNTYLQARADAFSSISVFFIVLTPCDEIC